MSKQKKKLYVAICKDRHIDEVVKVFDNPSAAILYAKNFVKMSAYKGSKIEEEEIDGWLYYCRYSTEDDSVRVEETWLNNERPE